MTTATYRGISYQTAEKQNRKETQESVLVYRGVQYAKK